VDIEFFRRLGFSQNNTCPPVRGAPPITAGMSRRLLFPSESLFTEVHERKALFTSIWKIISQAYPLLSTKFMLQSW
jgi:hypothetical protein